MFIINWMFDKLGYMPKIDIQVGKVQIDAEAPDFKMWPFPVEKPKKPARKTVVKKTVAKKAPAKKTTKKSK